MTVDGHVLQPVLGIVLFLVGVLVVVGAGWWLVGRRSRVSNPERCRNCGFPLGAAPVREDPLAWCSEKCRSTWVGWWLIQKEG